MDPRPSSQEILIGAHRLAGVLDLPAGGALGLVIFAHGSGSSRFSPRNRWLARCLQQARFATILFDLLSEAEAADRSNVFDIDLLADRLVDAIEWQGHKPGLAPLPCGLFGASTGAAAALLAAACRPQSVKAVVSRGGRPDLAGAALSRVDAATLLIVGGDDPEVLEINRIAFEQLHCLRQLKVVPGATHLFEEAGALEQVAQLAGNWFSRHLVEQAGV